MRGSHGALDIDHLQRGIGWCFEVNDTAAAADFRIDPFRGGGVAQTNFHLTDGTLFLRRSEVAGLLDFAAYVTVVEDAFRAHAEGRSLAPGLMHVDALDGEFHIKAGGLRDGQPRFGIKINGSFFQNRARFNMPNIQGIILLSDATHGYPLCVMDSMEVTIQRTGAATAVAAKYLARPDSSICTICGAGNQGRIQLKAVASVLPIRKAYAWSRTPENAANFATRMQAELGIQVEPVSDLRKAASQSDVIVTCTPARKPLLTADTVRKGTFIAAVGADSPDKQELDAALTASCKVVADLTDQITHVGEAHHAIDAGLLTRDCIYGEIGEIIAGHKAGRVSAEETILYDSTGTALQDVAAASAVYEAARAAGLGTTINLAS
jgi:ornithine cyclodeaminase/alanine dehydrogenase